MTEKTILLPPDSPDNGGGHYRLTWMTPKRRYLSCLRERWWVIVACVALALAAVLTYETLRPESYSSFAQLYTSGEIQLNAVSLFSEESQTYFGTQIELLKSARLQSVALEKTGFVPKPGQKAPVKVDVSQPMKTSILSLQATGSDPALTQRFLQLLIDEYLDYKKKTRISSSQDVLLSLTDELGKREKALEVEQEKWAEFQRTNNFAVLDEESKSAGMNLADLNLQLAKLKLDRDLLAQGLSGLMVETNDEQVVHSAAAGTNNSANKSVGDSTPVPASSDAQLRSALVQLAVYRAERDETFADHGAAAARQYDDSVAKMEKTVAALEEQNLTEKKSDLAALEKRIAAISGSIPSWESNVLSMNDRLSQAQRLKNNIQREQGYYEHLLGMLQNVDLGKNVEQERLSVLQPATPATLVNRYLPLRIALAVLFGLFASLGIVFCWYLLDDRFVSVHDVRDQFGEKILGILPQIKIPRAKPEAALLQSGDGRSGYAEAYRHLRSALLLASAGDAGPRTLLVTGAVPAEGKTTVSVNLARVLSRSGLRVALVDADPHGAGIHRLVGVEMQPGLLDFLRGEAGADDVRRKTDVPGLSFIPVGSHGSDGEGLFLRPSLNGLIDQLKAANDFVIIDGAPILAADDAALLVPRVDSVVLVVRPFHSRSRLLRQVLEMIYQRKAKQVAIVYNRARGEDVAGHYSRNGHGERNGKANRSGARQAVAR